LDDQGRSGLAEARAGNSYDFVRFCAAAAVLFSHHFSLARLTSPPIPGLGQDFGELAVDVFFCLSGFLIYRSLQVSTDWAAFLSSRLLRIFPNLAFALTVTSLVTLLWYSNYANLWAHTHYVLKNLLMFTDGVGYFISGVFKDSRDQVVNGSFWSLPGELWLYLLLFLIARFGGRRQGIIIVLGALLLSVVWGATPWIGRFWLDPIPHDTDSFLFSRLGSFFLSGAALAVFWMYLESRAFAIGVTGLLAIIFIRLFSLPMNSILGSMALAFVVIGLGSSRAMAWFSKGGDASYGMYIFAWPVQQFSLLLLGSFWLSMLVAFLVTTSLGYATWHTFERKALSYRSYLAGAIRTICFMRATKENSTAAQL
jgi:peptidoglycan/LPS O-acetylase OafA/YrhL